MRAPVELVNRCFYPDVRTLARFGWDYLEHIGPQVHQELHSPLDSAYMTEQMLITGIQAVSQPVLHLQNGGQVS